MAKRRSKRNFDEASAVEARKRSVAIVDSISPEQLVIAIKRAPSLRGMIAGYIAEEMFEKHVRDDLKITGIEKHDDHDRTANKSDRSLTVGGRRYTVQLKSIQTNSIHHSESLACLVAIVQNDASDKREIRLKSGESVQTTCYAVGEYDVLAVPLYPFTGSWAFAYKLNRDCRKTTSRKYSEAFKQHLLATTETITYPLGPEWTRDLLEILKSAEGVSVGEAPADPEEISKVELEKKGLHIVEKGSEV